MTNCRLSLAICEQRQMQPADVVETELVDREMLRPIIAELDRLAVHQHPSLGRDQLLAHPAACRPCAKRSVSAPGRSANHRRRCRNPRDRLCCACRSRLLSATVVEPSRPPSCFFGVGSHVILVGDEISVRPVASLPDRMTKRPRIQTRGRRRFSGPAGSRHRPPLANATGHGFDQLQRQQPVDRLLHGPALPLPGEPDQSATISAAVTTSA